MWSRMRLMLAAIVALRPAVRRRAAVLLLPAFVTTTLVCWGFQGWLPTGTPFGPLVLSPLEWEVLVLVPVVGVAACFAALRPPRRAISPGKPSFRLGASARVRPCWARIV